MILWRKHSTSAWQQELHTVSRQSELKWRNLERAELKSLKTFAQEQNASLKAIDTIDKNLEWCKLRTNFVEKRNFLDGMALVMFIEQYHGIKKYIKDWIIAFTK